MTYYDFIEIGTSDFDTLIQKADGTDKVGLSIDPFQKYLDRLPNPKNCTKICCAISYKEEEATIHYIPEEKIKKHDLPPWVRGGPRLYSRHPFLLTLCKEKNIDPDEVYETKTIQTKRLKTIINEYDVSEIKILKIDTEGCDGIILSDYFESCASEGCPYPYYIYYEHILLPKQQQDLLLDRAKNHNYSIMEEQLENTVLIRKT